MFDRLRWRDLIFPIGIVSGILVVLVPLPATVLDILLAANITLAIIVLLTTVSIRTPLEFSIFPSLLLAATLGRLILNVASTRLILTRAETDGIEAAGGVIRSFGDFVTGDSLIVGLVIFSILIIIQFLVITRGATRISEVAARFALDGMPGRQSAINSDLQSGVINEKQAAERRDQLTAQADFYGAMDGASKFVRGDAIAAVVITLINIVGGLCIGILQAGMSITEAGAIFTRLTIGDGLVSQLPAFLIALAAAMLVTRSGREVNLSSQLLRQLFARPEVMLISAGFLAVLVMTDLPALPLVSLAAGCGMIALVVGRQQQETEAVAEKREAARPQQKSEAAQITDYLTVEPLEVEIGIGLIHLADPQKGGDLMDRITGVRRQVASEVGLLLPPVRVRDNLQLDADQYLIKIANNRIDDGQLAPQHLLVADSQASQDLLGQLAVQPGTDQPVRWIPEHEQEAALQQGLMPILPAAVLATHLHQVVLRHADELLTRDGTRQLLEQLKRTSPVVVTELVPDVLSTGQVQSVLQGLLRENVPIRPLGVILEALADGAQQSDQVCWLVEHARRRMARTICQQLWGDDRQPHVVSLSDTFSNQLLSSCRLSDTGLECSLPANQLQAACQLLARQLKQLNLKPAVILVPAPLRPILSRLLSRYLTDLHVISHDEVIRDMQPETIKTLGQGLLNVPTRAAVAGSTSGAW